ncbi:hypothetical protein CEXT_375321 [Caerostris extrusa]|uniref:Uncharacterized protein n=1 Tax=Caerostris extrusa TaxID=172846 RepID=A0AAV4XIV0_CAEEX|nr:hypothetical protein CEXT_375321 [Caerostris extrusa]
MSFRRLEDKLPSHTLAVSDSDFQSLPRPELNLISERCGGWKEPFSGNKTQFLLLSGCQKYFCTHGSDFSVSFYAKISPIDLNPKVKREI